MMKFKRKNLNTGSIHRKKNSPVKSRKEIRKQYRQEKKAKKHAFFQKKKNYGKVSDVSFKNEGNPIVNTVKKKQEQQHQKRQQQQQQQCSTEGQGALSNIGRIEHQQEVLKKKKKHQEERRNRQYQKRRVQQLKDANEEEDKVIKKLEKQLKLKKRKRKTVSKLFSADGLDYLLEVCDEEGRQNAVSAEKNFLDNSDSEFEEDLALVTGKVASRTKVGSLSETTEDIHTDGDSDKSEGTSDSENDNSEIAERDIDLASEDLGSDLSDDGDDSDKNLNSSALTPKNNKKERYHNKLMELGKLKSKLVAKHYDRQQDSDEFAASSHFSQETHKIKKNKALKNTDKQVDSGRTFQAKESTEHSTPDVPPVCQKIIKKRRLLSTGDSDECNERTATKLKKKSKISGGDSKVREDVVTATKSTEKSRNNKKKTVTFEVDELSVGKGSEDESVGHDSGDDVWEDIYGRTRDKKGNIIHKEVQGKYVPPHLRVQVGDGDAKKQEQLLRLRRQMKGLLNRLAESNMNSIATQFDELYMSNSRNDMNETLTQLVLESLIGPVLTPERLVMEQVMLIAILHANVGSEVGAHFMQVLVKKFELLSIQCPEVERKELDNVVLTLSHLYNFRVFHCILMFDILEKLVERFGEKELELILIVLRSVGFSLRKDDPSALKDFILRVQKKASTEIHLNSSRVNFMLDILLAIKNNNMSKIPNYDTSHSEHLKKLLKGFLRKGNYITELKISLDDLLKAEERGRWWVVGSAWTGVLPGEGQAEDLASTVATSQPTTQYSHQLLELAKKQRMNTDVRRNIFCILMTAEDYLDAFEKLLHLGLKNQQEREIIYVILDCCLHEKKFNPYYGFLAQKLCDFDRKYQMTLQFTLWDRFKEMQSFTRQQTTNLAKLLTHLLLERGLPISILKVVEFVNVDKKMVRFLRQMLLGVLLAPSEEASLQVFQRVAQSPKLRMFCESLRLFVHHFLLRNMVALPEADTQLLTRRAKLADTLLSMPAHRLDLYQSVH